MKKLNYIIGAGILSIASLVSCDSILDKGPLDAFTNDNFWTSEGNVEGYANTFYNTFLGYGNSGGQGWFYYKTLSDDQAGNSFADWGHKGALVSNSTWSNNYIEIRRANVLIENIDKIAADDVVKNHWTGVARLMRAWYYYDLVRVFGDVPYTDKALDITDEGVLYGPRTNRDEVMDFVLADLDFACTNIRDVNSKITWSRNMANAMKADICLFEGTFRKYRKAADGQPAPDQAGATRFLTKCKEACEAVMDKYSLNSSYRANYNSTNLASNPEMIFYKQYKQSLLVHSLIAYVSSSTQISGMTRDAFDAYLFVDGKPLALTSEDKNLIAPLDAGGNLSIADMLAVRDKRLGETIDDVLMYVGNGHTRYGVGMESTSSTGYGVCKYDNPDIPVNFRNQTSSNYTHAPIFWLAVVYLNYAEACAELGTITDSDLNKTINKLRDRAGLPHLTTTNVVSDPANNHGVSDLIWEIRRERRCELMFDNWFRYYDLIRWHQLDKLGSAANPNILLGADVRNDPKCTAEKVGNLIDGSKGRAREFDNKYYLYPVPSGQIDLNPQLKPNNPGW